MMSIVMTGRDVLGMTVRVLLALTVLAAPLSAQWVPQQSGTSSEFRGLSVVSANVVWASVALPATVVTPTSSTSGLASASRMAIASSCPGSQSMMMGCGIGGVSPVPCWEVVPQ